MSRDMAVLAELDVLTARLRDGADDYVRRVRWVEQSWRDPKNCRPRRRTSGAPDRAASNSRAAGAAVAGGGPTG